MSFELHPGEIVGLLGPNGAGKTTTMECLAGLRSPSAGEIWVGGHRAGTAGSRALTGFVPEDPRLFADLSVWEHCTFMARAHRLALWQADADELLTRFGLQEHRDKPARSLSQGMRRKTGLAMLALHHAQFLVLDEPFNGLDPESQHELHGLLDSFRTAGAGVLMSSHRLAEMQRVADRFLVLREGRLVGAGSLPELRAAAGVGSGGDLERVYFRLGAPPQ